MLFAVPVKIVELTATLTDELPINNIEGVSDTFAPTFTLVVNVPIPAPTAVEFTDDVPTTIPAGVTFADAVEFATLYSILFAT